MFIAISLGADIYAVPLDVAYELNLGGYEGKRMCRFDDLWNVLDDYEIKLDVTYDEDGHATNAPYQMLEMYNWD